MSGTTSAVDFPTDRTLFKLSPLFAEYRAEQPIRRLRFHDGVEGWLVTSRDLGREVLGEARFQIGVPIDDAPANAMVMALTENDLLADALPFVLRPGGPGDFILNDPPVHTAYRRRLAGRMSAHSAEGMVDDIERIVGERLDAIAAMPQPVDLVEEFALPVPLVAICGLLGVPVDDVWHRRIRIYEAGSGSAAEYREANRQMEQAMADQLRAKLARPDAGLLSYLANDAELTEEEALGTALLLVHAGHHMTSNVIALGVLVLLEHPDVWDALVARPDSASDIIEELIRYISVLNHGPVARVAREDLEIGGVRIAAGERVQVSNAAANHDPAAFDRPDVFDPSRSPWGHLAFGHGIHQCIGQHIARAELRIAFTRLRERFPTLRLAVPRDELRVHPGHHQVHGVHELPVDWDRP
jgi:cytochrome P450